MATAETVELSELHAPKEASIKSFEAVLPELKHELVKLRHDHDKHEPEYFKAVSSLSDAELADISVDDLEAVRVGNSAYGLHLFCKVRLPQSKDGYIHVRLFIAAEDGTDGSSQEERVTKIHSIHTEEVEKADGDKVFRAIFNKKDELEWFDT